MSRLYQSVLMLHYRNHKMLLEFRQESERNCNFVQYQSGLLLDMKLRLNDNKSRSKTPRLHITQKCVYEHIQISLKFTTLKANISDIANFLTKYNGN